MPWIIERVEEKMDTVCQGNPLESLQILDLKCKPEVANGILDFMASQDLANDSLSKLVIKELWLECFPIESDVVSRLA